MTKRKSSFPNLLKVKLLSSNFRSDQSPIHWFGSFLSVVYLSISNDPLTNFHSIFQDGREILTLRGNNSNHLKGYTAPPKVHSGLKVGGKSVVK